MKTKKPDDLDRYIVDRKEKDAEFTAAYDSEQAETQLKYMLAGARTPLVLEFQNILLAGAYFISARVGRSVDRRCS
jgi:hypothetical protein